MRRTTPTPPRRPGAGARPRLLALALVLGGILAGPAASPAAGQQTVYVARQGPAWLGVSYDVRWVQAGERCEPQVLVEQVVQGSPAERAGLRSGDVILALDGEPAPAERLRYLGTRLAPGDSVRLRVERSGATREMVAVADARPSRPPSVMVSSGTAYRTTAPVVRLDGGTLVARNVESGSRGVTGYWFTTGEGASEYRRLSRWSRSDVDDRVATLLRCAEETERSAPSLARLDLKQVQRRADSLRVVITRRALERQREAGATVDTRLMPAARGEPGAPPAVTLPSSGSYVVRLEEHLVAGLRGVAGAEVTPLEPELAEYFRNVRTGLLVLRISPDTPADRAGLRPGDVIVTGNGRTLETVAELQRLLSFPDPLGVDLSVVRRGRTRTITMGGKRP